MYKFKNSLIALVGMMALIGLIAAVTPHSGYGQQNEPVGPVKPVKVANSTAEPVPVTGSVNVQGPMTVSGTVKAEQVGDWNVGIAGTPTVNLSPGATVGIAGTPTVQIGNEAANPVPVRDASNVRQPFHRGFNVFLEEGKTGKAHIAFTVPAGKRLIIEYVTANIFLPKGQNGGVEIGTYAPDVLAGPGYISQAFYRLPLQLITPNALAEDIRVGSEQVRFYAEPETEVIAGLFRYEHPGYPPGKVSAYIAISGYFVDVP
jgi:hypothetical protein